MKKIVNYGSKWLVATASLMTLYSSVEALPSSMTNQGFYMGAGIIGARTQYKSVSCDTGYCINFDGQSNAPGAKSTPGAALHVGYIFSNMPLQFELSYQYLYRLSYDNGDMLVNSISNGDSLSSDVHNNTLFANVIVPWRNNSPFTPFLLAGLGYNRSSVESKYTYQNQVTKGYTTVTTNYDQIEQAWQVGAGLYVNLTKQLLLHISYKYQDLGSVTWRVNYNGINDFSSQALTDNQGEIGLTYLFGANSDY